MTAFVVLAAGRGSRLGRIGDELPKCLLPLNDRAILSHQLDLAPRGARKIVVTGYRSEQVREYVNLAHPGENITIVYEPEWGRGPGASLLEAKEIVGDDDLVFVACDTLWTRDDDLWSDDNSWVATAPIPAGTPAARWCRVVSDGDFVLRIDDKTPDVSPGSRCWTALGHVARGDLATFWSGIIEANTVAGEVQLSSGLQAVLNAGEPIVVYDVDWLDVGDEQAFRSAIATVGGYDPLKPDQITYVLPERRRVVKFHVNHNKVRWRVERAARIGDAVPKTVDSFNGTMCAYEYVDGQPLYDLMDRWPFNFISPLLDWWETRFWSTRTRYTELPPPDVFAASDRFYRDKTFERVTALDPALRARALDVITRVDWDALIDGVIPGTFHGDLTFANVIAQEDDVAFDGVRLVGIDWREDYGGVTEWGDLRYDLGKMIAGTRFHWLRATYGDFRRWDVGANVQRVLEDGIIARFGIDVNDVRRIAALCLINSAALHAAPMDEILIARGCNWLESLT